MPSSESRQLRAGRSKRRILAAVVVVIAVGGCGSSQTTTVDSQLGPGIATAPETGTSAARPVSGTTSAGTSTARRQPRETAIHLPPPPSLGAPRSRAILATASRFARAYLLYQIGREPGPVQQAIRQTCTPGFAGRLLSQPVSVPATQRNSPAGQPALLGTVRYRGPASLGPGPSVQVVIARYHVVDRPGATGQLTIEVIRRGSGWRVEALG